MTDQRTAATKLEYIASLFLVHFKMHMRSSTKKHLISAAACAFLFSGILYFGHPVYRSGDDVYLLYLLGGGFGEAPTHLLHYQFGMHPWLGALIQSLFVHFPQFNGYSFVLYAFHFLACWAFGSLLISLRKPLETGIIFITLFFVFEVPFLLSPTFTNTALVLAMAGILGWLDANSKPLLCKKQLAGSILLVVASVLLRLHVMLPIILMAAPLMIAKGARRPFRSLCAWGGVSIFILFSAYVQQRYYASHITGWANEESYRQTVFSFYNSPKNTAAFPDSARVSFLLNGLFWDKTFLPEKKIEEIKKSTGVPSSAVENGFASALYWQLINARIFLAFLAIALVLTLPGLARRDRAFSVAALAIMLTTLCYLVLFAKLPFYFMDALPFFYCLLCTGWLYESKKPPGRILRPVAFFLMTCLVAWSLVRAQRAIVSGWAGNRLFLCAWQQIHDHPSQLFVVTDDHFPIDYFSVWDVPGQFEMRNLLYKDHWLNNTFQPIYQRYHISTAKDFLNNGAVFFTGHRKPAILDYYRSRWNAAALFTADDVSFSCLAVYRLVSP